MMDKFWKIALFGLIIVSMVSCSAENSSSYVLEKAKERRESQSERELFKDFFKEESEENQNKIMNIEEKEEVTEEFFDRSFKLVFFGDSLTQGVGDESKKGGFTSIVKQHYESKPYIDNVSVTNLGVRGNRTNHLLKRLEDPEVQEALAEADVIFMTVGGNDLMKVIRENFLDLTFSLFDKEQELYAKRLDSVLSEVRTHNDSSRIYLVGLFNPFYQYFQEIEEMNEVVTNWNATTVSVLDEYPNTAYVPIQDIFIEPEENLLDDDQFHPNQKGYQLIGNNVVEEIKRFNVETSLEEMLEEE
ncbi:SGNH/GDSL hydrolase family protein [Sutcliffiella horikoshii]|uniref:SGNH/GDSL hydrolase family protein n=1 Tax=Sutcliffiella horikoshii TaxID=79883 RepID=A0A5D4SK25_9BACI|nr:SGNH/GDSL hydrolase family protein [Sutcliffiella horikoshii]TYS63583.1 SGNH/GDSL hydrolase family protein [Sutcliffiella horikoshii]